MRKTTIMALASAICAITFGCERPKPQDDFKYCLDEFADIGVIRYRIPDWEKLPLEEKAYAYYLAEAAKYGRDIIWEQNFEYNLPIRKALETIIKTYPGDRECPGWGQFMVYAKRVFFSNGIHHHYGEHKFFPECSREYMGHLFSSCGIEEGGLIDVMFNPAYKIDVLKVLVSAYKQKPYSLVWPGIYSDGKLMYSEEGYPDYRVYEIQDYDIMCVI